MHYSLAEREDLARRKEQWLLRTGRGEDPEHVRRELKLQLKVRTLAQLRPQYQQGGCQWQALLSRHRGVATKGTPEVKAFVRKAKAKQPHLTAAALVAEIWERFEIAISRNRLSEILQAEGLSNPVGRPKLAPATPRTELAAGDVDHAGAFFPPGRPQRTGGARGRSHRA